MKKNVLIISISILLILSCLLASCGMEHWQNSRLPDDTSDGGQTASYDAMIRELENRIVELQQSQFISEAEYQKELSRLSAKLESLKAEQNSADSTVDSEKGSETEAPRFLYEVSKDGITVTGYTGKNEYIVIPAEIDGHHVLGIAESSFSSDTLKTVIITNGIQKIDWFAFRDCTALEAVTIPSSVTEIGHAAFSDTSSYLTIYCHSGSFAQAYAQSYGLRYAII